MKYGDVSVLGSVLFALHIFRGGGRGDCIHFKDFVDHLYDYNMYL